MIDYFLHIKFDLFNNYIANLDTIIIKVKYPISVTIVPIEINNVLINSKIKRLNVSKINDFLEKVII